MSEAPLLHAHGSIQDALHRKPTGTGLTGTTKVAVMAVGVALLIGAWVTEGEVTQSLQNPVDGSCTGHGVTDPQTGLCYENPTTKQANCSLTCIAKCEAGIGTRPWLITYAARIGWTSVLAVWLGWALSTRGTRSPNSVLLAYTMMHYMLWVPVLGAVVAGCAYTWFISLNGMPVSANTAVYNTTPIFVFIISVPVLGEKVTLKKVLATVFAVVGVGVVALDSNPPVCPTTTSGQFELAPYAWCLLSVLLYALYEVGVKKYLQSPDEAFPVANSLLLLGGLGLTSVLLFWPVFFALNGLDKSFELYEELEWPTGTGLQLLILNSALDTTFNLALILLIAATSRESWDLCLRSHLCPLSRPAVGFSLPPRILLATMCVWPNRASRLHTRSASRFRRLHTHNSC